MRARAAAVMLLAGLAAAAGPADAKLLTQANFPAAMAPLPGGGLIYGELTTGKIWKLSKKGHRSKHPIARLPPVASGGPAGLLGAPVEKPRPGFCGRTGTDG